LFKICFLTDFDELKCKSAENTFGGVHLSFYRLCKTSTIIVKNIKEGYYNEAYLKFHFEQHTGRDTIESIKLNKHKAIIKFFHYESKKN